MGTLGSILSSTTRSMSALSESLAVVQENIANAATPGYARRRAVLSPVLLPANSNQPGQGVEVAKVQTLRSRFLDFQVLRATQSKALYEKQTQFFSQVEPSFQLTGVGNIATSLDGFFGAIDALATNPADFTARAAVLSSANSLSASFRGTFADLTDRRTQLDDEARDAVSEINTLVELAATLAVQRRLVDGDARNATAETQLSQVLGELSELIQFDTLEQSDGSFSVVTSGGAPLLVGQSTFPLGISTSPAGITIRGLNNLDLTADIQGHGGSLGAILQARHETLPRLMGEVNRLAKSVADQVNEQLARGVDLAGTPGQPLFDYAESFFSGSGRTAGTTGDDPPAPPVSVQVDFSNGLTASITATLDSFFVSAAPPAGPAAGNTVSVTFSSADGSISRTVTTDPLGGGATPAETALEIRDRLNDQIAVDPELAGLVNFTISADGELKIILSENVGQRFTFTSSTSNAAFSTGLEPGGTLGGHSAEEIAATLNAALAVEAQINPPLAAANIRFVAVGGEVQIDGDLAFDVTVTDAAAGSGFASGLDDGLTHSAGGAAAAPTITVANLGPAALAAGGPGFPTGNQNALGLGRLANAALIDGFSFTEFYAGIVTDVGTESRSALTNLDAQQSILDAAIGLRESFSGVNMDEEAVRLMEFEATFQALVRVVQVVDSLTTEILSIVR